MYDACLAPTFCVAASFDCLERRPGVRRHALSSRRRTRIFIYVPDIGDSGSATGRTWMLPFAAGQGNLYGGEPSQNACAAPGSPAPISVVMSGGAVRPSSHGFVDQSHFTHAFRKHTGLTPGRYRAVCLGQRDGDVEHRGRT